jgi:hypothetical protein
MWMDMTEKAQQYALAIVSGWTEVYSDEEDEGVLYGMPPGGIPDNPGFAILAVRVPNFLHDLNAIALVEAAFTPHQRSVYGGYLFKMRGTVNECAFATAKERAVAALKTLDLWDPTK